MFFDTHAHLDDKRYNEDRDEIISSLISNNIKYIVNVGADIKTSEKSIELAKKYSFIYCAVGIHPHEAERISGDYIARLEELSRYNKVVAIGEIGLDYFYDTDKEKQKELFVKQLNLAQKISLPVIIHNREADMDCLDIIKKNYNGTGIFHCFSSSLEIAEEVIRMGFYISFSGVITFKNANKFNKIIQNIPSDKILIETDCPYLTPEPFRGKRNSPEFVPYVAEYIASVKGMSKDEVAKLTLQNGKRIYNITGDNDDNNL